MIAVSFYKTASIIFLVLIAITLLSIFGSTSSDRNAVYGGTRVAPSVQARDHLISYDNSTYGFTMKYPAEWTEEVLRNGISITAPGNPTESYYDTIEVLVYPAYCLSLDDIVAREIENLKDYNDFELDKTSTTAVGGLPGEILYYKYSDGNIGETRVAEYITSNGKYAYYISYYSKPENYDNHIDVARDFIKTIDIDSAAAAVQSGKAISNVAANTKYLTYENSTFGIKLDYPDSWSVSAQGSELENQTSYVVSLDAPCEGPNDGYLDSLQISVRSLEGYDNTTTISDYLAEAIDYYKTITKKFKVVESSDNFTIGAEKLPAYKLVFTGVQESVNINIKASVFGVIVDNKLYFIDYYAAVPKYPSYLSSVEHIINSIEFNNIFDKTLANGTTPEDNDFVEYVDKRNAFRLKYPSSWEFERKHVGAVVGFRYSFGNFLANIQVAKLPTAGLGSSLDRFVTNYLDIQKDNLTNFRMISSTETSLGNLDATQIVFTHDIQLEGSAKTKGKVMETMAIRNNSAYIVSFGTTSAEYPYQLPPIQALLNSFELLPEPVMVSGEYFNEKLGLKIDFPDGWSGPEVVENGGIMAIVFPDEMRGQEKVQDISLMEVVSFNKTDLTTGSFEDSFGESDLSCSTPTKTQITTLNNMSTMKFSLRCSYTDTISSFNMEAYYFEKGDKAIMVGFGTTSESSYNKYIHEFKESLESLSIEGTDKISSIPLMQI